MFDSENNETFTAINELCSLSAELKKPIVIWVGAGASAWCGLPLWPQLADNFHRDYCRYESAYDRQIASELLSQSSFPDFFSYCKHISSVRFNNLLASSLKAPINPPPVYARFISALKTTKQPLQILTTNVDEALEQNLHLPVILPADSERLKMLVQNREPFIAKLHGSISSISSTIFTKEDYTSLETNSAYIDSVKIIFDLCSVLFIGYGLQDEYVLKIIRHIEDLNTFFGTGPHFAALSNDNAELPPSVRRIKYISQPHTDHRTSIQIIEELGRTAKPAISPKEEDRINQPQELCSAHFLSDIYPAGTWTSSQTVKAKSKDGQKEIRFVVGHGLTQNELPLTYSTAMHDLVVGLICFDKIYAPLSALARLHLLTGENVFTELIKSDVLHFVYLKGNEAIIFLEEDALAGHLATVQLGGRAGEEREPTLPELIRQQMTPVSGREKEASVIFDLVEKKILTPLIKEDVTSLVHSLLFRPSVRQMLGISDAAKITAIPKWVKFPVLRLAQVVRIGIACQNLRIASVKFEFGNDKLAGPAFTTTFGKEFAEAFASYVLAGNFSTNLGEFVQRNPQTLFTILKFRESPQGIQLRKEILAHLAVSAGNEVAASINAGLASVLPTKVIEDARSNFARLSVISEPKFYPAVWNDADYGDKALNLWKKKSFAEFQETCNKLRLTAYDFCPCGSGEKVRFCCGAALA